MAVFENTPNPFGHGSSRKFHEAAIPELVKVKKSTTPPTARRNAQLLNDTETLVALNRAVQSRKQINIFKLLFELGDRGGFPLRSAWREAQRDFKEDLIQCAHRQIREQNIQGIRSVADVVLARDFLPTGPYKIIPIRYRHLPNDNTVFGLFRGDSTLAVFALSLLPLVSFIFKQTGFTLFLPACVVDATAMLTEGLNSLNHCSRFHINDTITEKLRHLQADRERGLAARQVWYDSSRISNVLDISHITEGDEEIIFSYLDDEDLDDDVEDLLNDVAGATGLSIHACAHAVSLANNLYYSTQVQIDTYRSRFTEDQTLTDAIQNLEVNLNTNINQILCESATALSFYAELFRIEQKEKVRLGVELDRRPTTKVRSRRIKILKEIPRSSDTVEAKYRHAKSFGSWGG